MCQICWVRSLKGPLKNQIASAEEAEWEILLRIAVANTTEPKFKSNREKTTTFHPIF